MIDTKDLPPGLKEIADSVNSNEIMQDLVAGVRYDEEQRRKNRDLARDEAIECRR